MTLYQGKYRIESARLAGYDYRAAGWYFVTICILDKQCVFGHVRGWEMDHSAAGEIARNCWEEIPKHHRGVELDVFIVMPNHVHGIVILKGLMDGPFLGHVVRSYKSAVRYLCKKAGFGAWGRQARFYDEILDDSNSVGAVREYIKMNPLNWENDPDYFPNALI